jgi:hypothetical protein
MHTYIHAYIYAHIHAYIYAHMLHMHKKRAHVQEVAKISSQREMTGNTITERSEETKALSLAVDQMQKEISTLAKRGFDMNKLKADIDRAADELSTLINNPTHAANKNKLERINSESDDLNKKAKDLREQRRILNQEANKRAIFDQKRRELSSLDLAVKDSTAEIKVDVEIALGNMPSLDTLESDLGQYVRDCTKTFDDLTRKRTERETRKKNLQESMLGLENSVAEQKQRHRDVMKQIKLLQVDGSDVQVWKEHVGSVEMSQLAINEAIRKGKAELHAHEMEQAKALEVVQMADEYTDHARTHNTCSVCERLFKDSAELNNFLQRIAMRKKQEDNEAAKRKREENVERSRKEVHAMEQANIKFAKVLFAVMMVYCVEEEGKRLLCLQGCIIRCHDRVLS